MMETTSLFDRDKIAAQIASGAQQTWMRGPLAPVIWPNEVHVWRARLDVPWSWTFDEALSLEDRARADRFRFESDRRKFCVARASLRLVLGRYLKAKPGRLKLDTGEFGKPYFADQKASQGLRFNLSHSHQLALIAITRDREVGVDVEYIRPNFVTDEVAGHFFSAAEAKELRSLPFELKTQSFFNCWTRKEAYIKARGEGLYCPLDQFDMSLSPGTPAMLLNSRIDSKEVSRWTFQDLFPGPDYAATLAVERGFSRLVLWDLL
ncbi:MAG TPA: 4'-phosphopantetheinyl transferase superfamily protein [Pyrinomonadaceae bacterium]|nr:4'-phosphopantetheinyl transferase superfamily protein [Pyrinomonadaceae bacterium]